MAEYLTNTSELTSVADAIRSKGGTSASLAFPAGFVTAINNISTGITPAGTLPITSNGIYDVTNYASASVNVSGGGGGGGSVIVAKQINFIDYDGTIVDSYTATEWANVTALPSNPSHTGLTAQGWNWTKNQIDTQLTAMPNADIWVGQQYVTTSGDTEIDVSFTDSARLSPYLACAVNGSITINWGDNSTSTITGTSLTTRTNTKHVYATSGDYTISIHVNSGSCSFYSTSTYTLLNNSTSTAAANRVYSNCVQAIRIGTDTNIGNIAFMYCQSLKSITIPNTVTSIANDAFSCCYSLKSVTIPNAVTSLESNTFYYCYSLVSVSVPSGITTIKATAFSNCFSIKSITIPNGVTSIGNQAFYYCYTIKSITIPSTVTSIGTNVFYSCVSLESVTILGGITSVSNNMFYYCYSLKSVTIPNTVTSIGSNAFSGCSAIPSITIPNGVTSIGNSAFTNCHGVAEYHVKPTSPPTLGTTVFNNIQSDCVIYVPSASLNTYKTTNNWSTYSSYIQGE